eukprot:CAMPEP_0170846138 /NCGR_PEP_ID=MMETSP0734-20130129/7974_1 /TAXON_ID=186038 /ORGANISM="Fragilariopsis kerguelensis, Strain L26-C5" /LENGTH=124 /DNA_ID=CAMNT_0011215039 /DNA_START=73 /DNA_END=445 /DNA_ORIENTATION=-
MLFEMNSLELRSGPDSPRAELKKLVRKNQQVPASISTNIDDEDLRLVTEDVIDDLPWDDTSQTIRQCTWCGKFEDKQTTAAPMNVVVPARKVANLFGTAIGSVRVPIGQRDRIKRGVWEINGSA